MSQSASSIADADTCLRYYAWRWLVRPRLRYDPGPAIEFGRKLHNVAEKHHKTGEPPDLKTPEGRAYAHGYGRYCPPIGTAEAEGKFSFTALGITYNGRMDLRHPLLPQGVDHKTCSGKASEAKAEFEPKAATDPQGLIYAMHIAIVTPGFKSVGMRWIWYRNPKESDKCESDYYDHEYETDTLVDAFYEHVHKKAAKLEYLKDHIWPTLGNDPMRLMPNYSNCYAYGGCPFRKECGVP